MDELRVLRLLDRVKAPADFEQKLMARLSLERRGAVRRRPALGLSLAGAFAGLLAVFVALNVFILRDRSPVSTAAVSGGGRAQTIIPVIERVDYDAEVRGEATGPNTIYLLEQISDTAPRGIVY